MPTETVETCFFCKRPVPVPASDYYCAGCSHYICGDDDCAGNRNLNMPFGQHQVELHAEETEWESDDSGEWWR